MAGLFENTKSSIRDKDVIEALKTTETVADVLLNWGNDLTQDLRESLRREQSSGTSLALQQSIKALPLQFEKESITLAIVMLDYWDFINSGVEGIGGEKADGSPWIKKPTLFSQFANKKYTFKKPSIKVKDNQPLKDWSLSKGLNPYAVGRSIAHRGIEANEFFNKVVTPQRIKDLSEKVAKVGGEELATTLKILMER